MRRVTGRFAAGVGVLCLGLGMTACGGSGSASSTTTSSSAVALAPTSRSTSSTTTSATSHTRRADARHGHAKAKKDTPHPATAKTTTQPTSATHTKTAPKPAAHPKPKPKPKPKPPQRHTPSYVGPMHVTLVGQNHDPTVNKRWWYTVTVTDARGHRLSGVVDVEFTFNGIVVGHDTPPSDHFKDGRWHEILTYPRRSIGEPIDLQVIVHTTLGHATRDWAVKAKR